MDGGNTSTWPAQWGYEPASASGLFGFGDQHGMQTTATSSDWPLDGDAGSVIVTTKRPCVTYCDIPWATAKRILFIINVIIIPSISIFGVFGSISSMVVLVRQGLKKSSSILLMAVAVSDFVALLGNNNINYIFKTHYKRPVTYETAQVFFGCHLVQIFLYELGQATSVFVTVLITLERIVAVYLPLKFPTIVTPTRTVVAIVSCLPLSTFKALMGALNRTLAYKTNKRIHRLVVSDFYKSNTELYFYTRQIWDYIIGLIPVLTVLVGSIVIGIGIKIAANKRAKMSSAAGRGKGAQTGQNNRTTITLLAICIQFTLTLGTGFLIETFAPDEQTWTSYIVRYRLNFVLYTLNSSSNFLIYVAINKNFRQTYLAILMPWRYKNKGKTYGEI